MELLTKNINIDIPMWKQIRQIQIIQKRIQVQYPAIKVKIGKQAHAMTDVNPQKRVRSGSRGVSIFCRLATPVKCTFALYTRVKQTGYMTKISVIIDVTENWKWSTKSWWWPWMFLKDDSKQNNKICCPRSCC